MIPRLSDSYKHHEEKDKAGTRGVLRGTEGSGCNLSKTWKRCGSKSHRYLGGKAWQTAETSRTKALRVQWQRVQGPPRRPLCLFSRVNQGKSKKKGEESEGGGKSHQGLASNSKDFDLDPKWRGGGGEHWMVLSRGMTRFDIWKKKNLPGEPRWLSRLSVQILILAQVSISRLWVQAP